MLFCRLCLNDEFCRSVHAVLDSAKGSVILSERHHGIDPGRHSFDIAFEYFCQLIYAICLEL